MTMPFYTVKAYNDSKSVKDFGLDAVSRIAAIRITNEWLALENKSADMWSVYRNADMTNASYYRRVNGRYKTIAR
jgi:hypothetical protein